MNDATMELNHQRTILGRWLVCLFGGGNTAAMSRFDSWMFKRIVRRNVKQGYDRNLYEMFVIIRAAAEAEYTEDNMVTLDSYMHDNFEKTQRTTWSAIGKVGQVRQSVEIKGEFDKTGVWATIFGDGTCSSLGDD